MTQKTKLEIIGPYTPEHEGPFCTRNEIPVELKFRDGRGNFPLGGYIGVMDTLYLWSEVGNYEGELEHTPYDLMNAREVPVAREFWINEYTDMLGVPYTSKDAALDKRNASNYVRTIHVREVMPGEE